VSNRAVFAAQLLLALLVAAIFALAEVSRAPGPERATVLSMIGWVAFTLLFLWWLWEDCGVRIGLHRLARVGALAALAFGVFYLFYRRSHLLEAGIEVDATYTFLGAGWFLSLANPITFSGHTVSFAQMALQLLGHLPAHLVGFDRLGPFAIHVAIMLQLAVLFAVLTTGVVAERPLGVQAAIVVGLTAVFSNRLTLLLCNLTGYAVPSLSIGIMFLWTVLAEAPFAAMAPRIGGLLLMSVAHNYPGFFFAVPLVALWVVAGPDPCRRIATFARANLPLWTMIVIAFLSLAIHPEMLLSRLQAVTAPALAPDEFQNKIRVNWAFLTGAFPAQFVQVFFRESPGSWHLLNLPPLGGLLAPILLGNWILTAVALGRRGRVFVGRLAIFALCLLCLTALQHVVTGFENYRDMVLVVGLWISGVGFVLLAPRMSAGMRTVVTFYAVAVAVYAYHDVARIAGRHYAVAEYAPAQQAAMESLRRFWRHGGGERLRGATLTVVSDAPFPLETLYENAARLHGITLKFTRPQAFCEDPPVVVTAALIDTCERVAFAVPPAACPAVRMKRLGRLPAGRHDGTALYVFERSCGNPEPRDPGQAERIDLS
jgi:hypothetical protein